MMYSDNPLRDFEQREAEHEAWLATRPICEECGERIEDDGYFAVDGKIYCKECMEDKWRNIA